MYIAEPIQHIIIGIDAFLTEITRERKDNPHSLNLVLFSDSPDDTGVLRWLNAWKERWQAAEGSARQRRYANSTISVYYHVVPENDLDQLERQIQQFDLDVFFFINFTRPQKSQFLPINDDRLFHSDSADYLKFPVLEKASCVVKGDGAATERKLVLSNRQFQLSTLHAELMARLRNPYSLTSNKHVVVSTSEFESWVSVIDTAHKNCVWVVCIDPIVDEKLIRTEENTREIIGFGTGVGPHGEFNFTLSTEAHLRYKQDAINL